MTVKRHLPNQWKYTPCSLPWTALVDECGIGIPAKVRSFVVAENRGIANPPGVSRVYGGDIAPSPATVPAPGNHPEKGYGNIHSFLPLSNAAPVWLY